MNHAPVSFSTSAAAIHRLGSELIRDSQTAFFELIKNSYDADATRVDVTFKHAESSSGEILIRDDGSGMNHDDIASKWARVAGENKVVEPCSPLHKRRRLGAKGIGRFSVAKLGGQVKIITKRRESSDQLVFRLDFATFTDDRDLQEIEIPIDRGKPREGFVHGTMLEIRGLREPWRRSDVKKLRDQLSHLIDPDADTQDFVIHFDCSEWPELGGRLENPIAGKESHAVRFSITADGVYERDIVQPGAAPKKIPERRDDPAFGAMSGVIRYFKEGLKAKDRRLSADTDESHMGVKIYRDGCRVRPYGEKADDWLDIQSRRASGGGKYHVNPSSVSGSIHISGLGNTALRDATNRESGIVSSLEFDAFRQFVREHVDHLNDCLEQESRSEEKKQKRQTVQRILDTVVGCLNSQDSPVYSDHVARIDRSRQGAVGESARQHRERVIDEKEPDKEEWMCKACDEKWRVLKGGSPTHCMELAVNRQGEPRGVDGCGSADIERARRESKGDDAPLTSIVSGEYAMVSGREMRIRVDYDMGREDDEYTIDAREIVVNGNHPAYSVAEKLDGMTGRKYDIGDDVFVPALSTHIAKCACLAWAELHFHASGKWSDFKERYDTLLSSICQSMTGQLA